jgi:alpha/beta superfamily hydrolase
VQTEHIPEKKTLEQAGYFTVPGAHLYTVLHQVDDPVARVLLIGPFASERHNSYNPWVRWARYLAARRIEVLRYDYRGVGESTGVFEDMTFEDWAEDVQLLANWFRSRSPDFPLILNGLELGALLAGKTFQSGVGDALLLWSPPANASQALRSTLLRWANLEQLFKYGEDRKPVTHYIRQLEQGSLLEIEGYQWSSRLWHDSFDFSLPVDMDDENSATLAYKRPVRIIKLGKEAAPLTKGFIGYDEIRDLSWVYSYNFDWIVAALNIPRGRDC